MFCSHCGNKLPDDRALKYCPYCGAALGPVSAQQRQSGPTPAQQRQSGPTPAQQRQNRPAPAQKNPESMRQEPASAPKKPAPNKTLVIILIAAVAVLAILVVVLLLKLNDGSSKENKQVQTAVTETESEESATETEAQTQAAETAAPAETQAPAASWKGETTYQEAVFTAEASGPTSVVLTMDNGTATSYALGWVDGAQVVLQTTDGTFYSSLPPGTRLMSGNQISQTVYFNDATGTVQSITINNVLQLQSSGLPTDVTGQGTSITIELSSGM